MRCEKITTKGLRCKNPALAGSSLCHLHTALTTKGPAELAASACTETPRSVWENSGKIVLKVAAEHAASASTPTPHTVGKDSGKPVFKVPAKRAASACTPNPHSVGKDSYKIIFTLIAIIITAAFIHLFQSGSKTHLTSSLERFASVAPERTASHTNLPPAASQWSPSSSPGHIAAHAPSNVLSATESIATGSHDTPKNILIQRYDEHEQESHRTNSTPLTRAPNVIISPETGSHLIEQVVARLKGLHASGTSGRVNVSVTITNVTLIESGLVIRQATLARVPDGTYATELETQVAFAQLAGTSSRLEETPVGVVKFIVEAPMGTGSFTSTLREYTTGVYANNIDQGVPIKDTSSYFGFTFPTKAEAEDFRRVWVAFISSLTVLSLNSETTQQTGVILGCTKNQVEDLLRGWITRESNRSTPLRPIVYYIKDVELIVTYQGGKAVGVAVIDKPGSGISPIPLIRFNELIGLIGGGQPKTQDILRDESGIREFSVGDAD